MKGLRALYPRASDQKLKEISKISIGKINHSLTIGNQLGIFHLQHRPWGVTYGTKVINRRGT